MASNQRALILAFALFIFSFVVYIPSIKSDFVWDDVETIERSYYNLKNSELISALIPYKKNKALLYYKPLIYTSYYIDYSMFLY